MTRPIPGKGQNPHHILPRKNQLKIKKGHHMPQERNIAQFLLGSWGPNRPERIMKVKAMSPKVRMDAWSLRSLKTAFKGGKTLKRSSRSSGSMSKRILEMRLINKNVLSITKTDYILLFITSNITLILYKCYDNFIKGSQDLRPLP